MGAREQEASCNLDVKDWNFSMFLFLYVSPVGKYRPSLGHLVIHRFKFETSEEEMERRDIPKYQENFLRKANSLPMYSSCVIYDPHIRRSPSKPSRPVRNRSHIHTHTHSIFSPLIPCTTRQLSVMRIIPGWTHSQNKHSSHARQPYLQQEAEEVGGVVHFVEEQTIRLIKLF